MKKPLKDIEKKANDLFTGELTVEDKAWDIILEFYHQVLTRMEERSISQADLARKLSKSRSAISQLLNKTPNISIMRMVEIADAVGVDLELKIRSTKKSKAYRRPYYQRSTEEVTPRMEVNEE